MNKLNPPKWPLQLLQWFCPDHLFEEIEGDLLQKFEKDINAYGDLRAKRRLMWNTIRFFRPEILWRNKFSIKLSQFGMVHHFFKIFLRASLKNATYSLINIVGLAIGLTACTFISLYVWNERSYDEDRKSTRLNS